MASLSIAALISFFAEEKKSIERGENHYRSEHIESFSYHQGILRGEVQASMKKKVYRVTIYLDDHFNIKSTECECPKGKFKCSHAAALFINGIHNLSRTDIECQWRKKKSNTSLSLQAVEELFPLPKNYVAITRSPNTEDRQALYGSLKAYGRFTGLCWLMCPEPAPQAKLPVPTIEEIIYSGVYPNKRYTATIGLFGSESQTHRSRYPVSQSDNCRPTRQPNLASCKEGTAYSKKFWIRSACQKSDPFTSQTAPWRV